MSMLSFIFGASLVLNVIFFVRIKWLRSEIEGWLALYDKCFGYWRDTQKRLMESYDEHAQLYEDTARMDWLESARPNALCLCVWGDSTAVPNFETKPTGYIWEINDTVRAETLRTAIDVARSQPASDK